ncbi:hypothetical protein PInf_028975 [Phytophthora infestans]|nr:hypothetical protein PInf_028975 [Phytophthora infestans]
MRASAHLEEVQLLVGERSKIKNTVPPFPSGPLESWSVFEREFKKYKAKYNLKFRVRSSENTDLYNKVHDDQMPTAFEWTYKTYRCTHGLSHGLDVKNHTHTHPTSQTEASSYLTTKTLPLDDRDLEDVKTLADARVSSAHITNFLNDRIGAWGKIVLA